jgi:hypothetical protein
MAIRDDTRQALDELDFRLKTVLPEQYRDRYDDVQPVSMGSAGLKYGADGLVAWNEMWQTFCDLAMAGGPPHKGTLLEPATGPEIDANSARYDTVVDEICRGVGLVTELIVRPSSQPGWVRVSCFSDAMAGWLLRAIVMENVSARADGRALDLPASPHFRVEKEIKNVVTVAAKTCHYWTGHMPRTQKETIAVLFDAMAKETPLIEPAWPVDVEAEGRERLAAAIAATIQRDTGLPRSVQRYPAWVGIDCPSVHAAVWMMRAVVMGNVLARREGTTLFVPVNPVSDPDGAAVTGVVRWTHALSRAGRARGSTGVQPGSDQGQTSR